MRCWSGGRAVSVGCVMRCCPGSLKGQVVGVAGVQCVLDFPSSESECLLLAPEVWFSVSRVATNTKQGRQILLLALVSPYVKGVGGIREGLLAACLEEAS